MALLGLRRSVWYALALCALLLPARHAAAQQLKCDDAETRVGKADRVIYDPARMRVELALTKAIKPQDLEGAPMNTWVLIDVTEAATARPLALLRNPVRGDSRPADSDKEFDTILLYLNQQLKPKHEYRVFQKHLKFYGCESEAILEWKWTVKDKTGGGGASPGSAAGGGDDDDGPSYFGRSPSEGREDSNVYLAGQIEGAHGSKTQFSGDVVIDVPLASVGVFDSLGPYFSMKASTADEADANTLNLRAKLRHTHVIRRKADPVTHQFVGKDERLLTGLVFDLLPGVESDRRFDNVNALLGMRLYFIPRVQGGARRFYFQPFVGYEIGRNLKSPVPEAEDRALSRPLFGASLYVHPFPKRFKSASVQIDYVRRFLLRREVSFEEEDDELKLVSVGRGPRDYLKGAFGLDFSDYTGLTISYEYGRLPPNFQLVDSKFAFGIVYKFKTTFPAKE